MEKGDVVVCRAAHGYRFTEGKEYTVLRYDPPEPAPGIGFTWPAYVTVRDDEGHKASAHATRFATKGE